MLFRSDSFTGNLADQQPVARTRDRSKLRVSLDVLDAQHVRLDDRPGWDLPADTTTARRSPRALSNNAPVNIAIVANSTPPPTISGLRFTRPAPSPGPELNTAASNTELSNMAASPIRAADRNLDEDVPVP